MLTVKATDSSADFKLEDANALYATLIAGINLTKKTTGLALLFVLSDLIIEWH